MRQQLDSFDEFITNEILEIVTGTPAISIMPSKNYAPGKTSHPVRGRLLAFLRANRVACRRLACRALHCAM